MAKLDPLKILECQLGLDLRKTPFMDVVERLAAGGMTTFRLNLEPNIAICIAFEAESGEFLNCAVDKLLDRLEAANHA